MKYLPCDVVEITACKRGHTLPIGTKTAIIQIDNNRFIRLAKGRAPWVEVDEIAPACRIWPHKDKETWTVKTSIGGKKYGMRWSGYTKSEVVLLAREWAANIANF